MKIIWSTSCLNTSHQNRGSSNFTNWVPQSVFWVRRLASDELKLCVKRGSILFVPKAEMFIFYYRSRKSSKTGTEPNSDSLNSEGQSHLYISSALPVFLTPKILCQKLFSSGFHGLVTSESVSTMVRCKAGVRPWSLDSIFDFRIFISKDDTVSLIRLVLRVSYIVKAS